jgi:hypothetical protein
MVEISSKTQVRPEDSRFKVQDPVYVSRVVKRKLRPAQPSGKCQPTARARGAYAPGVPGAQSRIAMVASNRLKELALG